MVMTVRPPKTWLGQTPNSPQWLGLRRKKDVFREKTKTMDSENSPLPETYQQIIPPHLRIHGTSGNIYLHEFVDFYG